MRWRRGPRSVALRDGVRAEWTKMRTVPGSSWLVVGAIVLSVALSAVTTATVSCAAGRCTVDAARTTLAGVEIGQALVAILAVLTISGEYSTGMIRATLVAMPRRTMALAAKAAVLTGVVTTTAVIAVIGCLAVGWIVLPGRGVGSTDGHALLSLVDGPVLRSATGSVAYLALIGLLALGVATAVRDSATAIGLVLGLLYVFPLVAHGVSDPRWQRRLQQIGPMTSGLAVQATTSRDTLPIAPWAGLGVLAAWAAAALLIGGLLMRWRDA
jgi:ABC-2 type transport system permease protein